jgi:signal transduction histidine kinase
MALERRTAPLLRQALWVALLVSAVALAVGQVVTRHCHRTLNHVRAHIEQREEALHRVFASVALLPTATGGRDPALAHNLQDLDEAVVGYEAAIGGEGAADWREVRDRLQAFGHRLRGELARGPEAAALAVRDGVPSLLQAIERYASHEARANAHRLTSIDRAHDARNAVEIGLWATAVAYMTLLALLARRRERLEQAEITARVSRLEESTRELRAFTGRVAHDLRGPLTPILVSSQMIEQAPVPETVRHLAERIEGSAGRLRNMIDLLLSFARLEAPQGTEVRTDVGRVVAEVLDDARERACAACAVVEVARADETAVVCEPEIVASAVHNLLDNALKYGLDGDRNRITIRVTRADGDGVGRIEVADQGPGIPPELMPHVFEPLFRGTRGGEGIGLGLATVKRLVEARAGRILVAHNDGGGACFTVELPLAEPR